MPLEAEFVQYLASLNSSEASRPQSQVPSTTTLSYPCSVPVSLMSIGPGQTSSNLCLPAYSPSLSRTARQPPQSRPLPSLFSLGRAYHQYRKKPVSLLLNYFIANVSTTDDVQFSNMILDSARELAPILAAKWELGRDLASGPSHHNATRLRLRIERLRRERRDGPAMQKVVEGLQNLLDQELVREVDIKHLPTSVHPHRIGSRPTFSPSPKPSPLKLPPAKFFAPSRSSPMEPLQVHPGGRLAP